MFTFSFLFFAINIKQTRVQLLFDGAFIRFFLNMLMRSHRDTCLNL